MKNKIKQLLQLPSSKVLHAVNRAIYISFGFLTKNTNNWQLHCVSWINFNLQMATVYLVFLKSKTLYRKYVLYDSSYVFIKSRLSYIYV